MLQKVNKSIATVPGSNYLLAIVNKATAPNESTEKRCRFDMFIRLKPGVPSLQSRNGLTRTWCYRGDKFTNEEFRMLRSLLKLLIKNIHLYDRVELYDNRESVENRIILKITDGIIDANKLNQYSMMLLNYALPEYLKTTA